MSGIFPVLSGDQCWVSLASLSIVRDESDDAKAWSKGWTNKAKQTRCEARDVQYYVCTQCTVHYTYMYVCIIFFDNIQAPRLTIQLSYGPLTVKSKFDDAPTNASDFNRPVTNSKVVTKDSRNFHFQYFNMASRRMLCIHLRYIL